MSQYSSRLYIKVKDEKVWKKLSRLKMENYGLWNEIFKEVEGKEFYIDGDWSIDEFDLKDLAREIIAKIPECIILADTHNYNVDPYNYAIYYIDKRFNFKYKEGSDGWYKELSDILDWCKANGFRIRKNQREFIEKF